MKVFGCSESRFMGNERSRSAPRHPMPAGGHSNPRPIPFPNPRQDEVGIWIVFRVVDVVSTQEMEGTASLTHQEKEGILCGKMAAALETFGEARLGRQVWEQTQRILCVDTVDDAVAQVRPYLDAMIR